MFGFYIGRLFPWGWGARAPSLPSIRSPWPLTPRYISITETFRLCILPPPSSLYLLPCRLYPIPAGRKCGAYRYKSVVCAHGDVMVEADRLIKTEVRIKLLCKLLVLWLSCMIQEGSKCVITTKIWCFKRWTPFRQWTRSRKVPKYLIKTLSQFWDIHGHFMPM